VLLIEDTVPFLQEYFEGKISRGNFQVEPARLWYLDVRNRAQQEDALKSSIQSDDGLKPLEALLRGIADQLLQFTPPPDFPETFLFDSDRLWQLRATIQNLINLEIAWYIFESWVHSKNRYLRGREEILLTFRSRILSLMEDGLDPNGHIPSALDDDPDLRGGAHWYQNMRSIALEIARFACLACGMDDVEDEVITPIEAALEWHLTNESDLFRHFQNTTREKILSATIVSTKKYLPLSPLAICESQRAVAPSAPLVPASSAATNPASSTGLAQTPTPSEYDIERIGMRLAHIGVLHWRVWAPLLYLRDEIADLDSGPAAFV
jgi:hypothetical protein